MDINKTFYKTLFKNLFSDPCDVQFWDGEINHFGEGESRFKIIFNEAIPKGDILSKPSLALGEGFMSKKIDIEGNVQEVIESLYNNKESFLNSSNDFLGIKKLIKNNTHRSKENVTFHYDIGNDFYKLWLDETMTYSCGYFKTRDHDLTTAQKNKVDHILKKLNVQEGNTLLDIGCGWGELIITSAKKYKVKALGITLSSEQHNKVTQRIADEGLEDLVEVQLIDYRDLKNRKFDRIVSVGMIEHVGKDYLKEYFATVNHLLDSKGISLLHCITGRQENGVNTWINKYIFPGGYIPSIKELVNDIIDKDFYLIDSESLRFHYAITLENWAKNFENAVPEIAKTKNDHFIRMWRLYLNSCAASFKCGNIDLYQFLFTKGVNNELPLTRDYMYS